MKVFSRILQAMAAAALCVVTACSDKAAEVAVPAGANIAVVAHQLNEPLPAEADAAWAQANVQICQELEIPLSPTQGIDPMTAVVTMWEELLPPGAVRILKNVLGLKEGQKHLSASTFALTWNLPGVHGRPEYFFNSPEFLRGGLALTVLNKDFDYAAFRSDLWSMGPEAKEVIKEEGAWLKMDAQRELEGLFAGFREAKKNGLVFLFAADQAKAEESYAGGSAEGAVAWAISTKGLAKGPVLRVGVNKPGELFRSTLPPREQREMSAQMPGIFDLTSLKLEVAYEGTALTATVEVESSQEDALKQLEAMAQMTKLQAQMGLKQERMSAMADFLGSIKIEAQKTTLTISCKVEPSVVVNAVKEYAAKQRKARARWASEYGEF